MILSRRLQLPAILLAVLAALAAAVVYAQLEGSDRGIPPIESATTLEVTGVNVDVSAKTGDEARLEGWRQAQAKAWQELWAKTTGGSPAQAPKLANAELDEIVSSIVIEQEQIGPTRYIARLGVLFDRARAGALLGVGDGVVRHSAPMLVIPVLLSGSTLESFESRNEWQRACARFRTGARAIDYVRPVGNVADPLLLNAAQTDRPGRGWWRMLLDQYGAADVIVPEVRIQRSYPGGPAIGTFYARHGPDNVFLGSFALRARDSAAIPQMLDEGIRRLDAIYTRALALGVLSPDSTLIDESPLLIEALAARIEALTAATQVAAPPPAATGPVPVGAATTYSLQVETPNAASVSQAEVSVSRIQGVP